ncbi:MAG: hypothetical protein AABX76_01500 [Nanoarchaeota archaeon]
MEKTTIQISSITLERMKNLKSHDRQSYDELLNSVLDDFDEEPLSEEEIQEIQVALENVKKGKVKSIEQVAKELGVKLT